MKLAWSRAGINEFWTEIGNDFWELIEMEPEPGYRTWGLFLNCDLFTLFSQEKGRSSASARIHANKIVSRNYGW